MLGNGYKERLASAQNSIGSLLLNLPKQSSMTTDSSQPQRQPAEDNEPALDSPFKHALQTKLTISSALSNSSTSTATLPSVSTPVLESNSTSRPAFQRQEQQQPNQLQPRASRLPKATQSLSRLADQFPELGSVESDSDATARLQARASAENFSAFGGSAIGGSRSATASRWDMSHISGSSAFHDANNIANFLRIGSGNASSNFCTSLASTSQNQSETNGISEAHANLTVLAATLEASIVIQRAVRRFLIRKQARIAKLTRENSIARGDEHLSVVLDRRPSTPALASLNCNSADTLSSDKFDMESLQQKYHRQSAEIDQLKELITRLLLEAEEARRKLRQRDCEIDELMQQQQKLTQSASMTYGFDMSSLKTGSTSAHFSTISTTHHLLGQTNSAASSVSSSVTVPSFSAFNVPSMVVAEAASVSLDQISGKALGVTTDDMYESNLSSTQNAGGPAPHPLSLPSRSNSITSLQTRSHQSLGLKIKPPAHTQLLYQQQYQGLMDIVDSPSSEYGPQDTSAFGGSAGRGHGFNQNSFPMLQHRGSGSLSANSSVRGVSVNGSGSSYDSPALEQHASYPWNVPGNMSHSHSWTDDMTIGYGYDSNLPSPASFQQGGGMSHNSGAFDPNFINQTYSHNAQQHQQHQQQQQQQQQQSAQQHHQSLPPHRHGYRRHSEKSVHLDYQICVDRILQATDQQASIHLQQKLKTSPPEQKIQIIDAILGQAYALMSNRFGNFLIQRCFEFGTPQQIDALAQAMRGNVLALACDPFGCHVVQKALDNVEESWRARIVTEMFRRIRETIVHRYACHVWQKVFEIRWTDAPPAVMTYVNNAVAGRWASVAVDETGSLVVQNIFENCAEHDKRPVLNEILQSVTTIARGQWGNWVIQHILEHGAPLDRAAVTQKILEDAVNLSLDQYASKVVEKTLRMAALHSSVQSTSSSGTAVGGNNTSSSNNNNSSTNQHDGGENAGPPTVTVHSTTIKLTQEEVMSQYIHIVCDGVQDRPRIPLIDIAADQYGNYIVQYILTNAGPQHRETCAALIKRHMVSLRGSKYGQKVAFMVERWRGSPFSGNNGNSGGNGGNGHGSLYGSKLGPGVEGGGNGHANGNAYIPAK
ncbi:hypothetical protein EDD11_008484 [Mortierella claussenii]|nr:hypothetical protein EDD11_008484 [Mortierella claussenii]